MSVIKEEREERRKMEDEFTFAEDDFTFAEDDLELELR
jgi:hypothetical protein